ncbi:nuclear transport factor 2 family protein [Stutzerimonas tarimensis]|uniref:Nuclear transport factor 2 family protein n=1 Tax=Stutzerimonas tarimensis TaxID=1507735 RepID=A0ABV7T739_9GAMM
MELSQRIQRVADHQAILEQMARYIQAVDRLDLALLKYTFHPDGVVRFGIFDGNAHEFCDFDIPFIRDNLTMGAHRFSTATIEFHSDTRAVAESYMLGNAAAPTPDGVMLNFPDNMRYEDVWEKRDGVWRMSSRDLVMDWNAFWPYSQREDGPFAEMRRSRRDTQDPAYALRAGTL